MSTFTLFDELVHDCVAKAGNLHAHSESVQVDEVLLVLSDQEPCFIGLLLRFRFTGTGGWSDLIGVGRVIVIVIVIARGAVGLAGTRSVRVRRDIDT